MPTTAAFTGDDPAGVDGHTDPGPRPLATDGAAEQLVHELGDLAQTGRSEGMAPGHEPDRSD